jgi:hypothetical protein
MTNKRAARLNQNVIDTDAISDTQPAAPSVDFDTIRAFKLEMNDWLWERKDALDYYKLVDEINASIYQATDKRAKMNEWRAWATKTRLALRYLNGLVDLCHSTIGVNAMELIWNVRAFNAKIIPAWNEFDALRQGLTVEPAWADTDESGQRFDDENYAPF